MNYKIKLASDINLEEISQCHRAAFPTSLSSALGLRYVRKMLAWYLSTENTFLIYVNDGDRCIGYCGGMIKRKPGVGSASSMAQYSFSVAVKTFITRPWLLFHREIRKKNQFILKNIMNKIFKKKGNQTNSTVVKFEPYVGLVVIGVDPVYHGKGFGSLLLQEFEKIAMKRGLNKMVLTVQSKNSQAIASYLRNGWSNSYVRGELTAMEKRLG